MDRVFETAESYVSQPRAREVVIRHRARSMSTQNTA
jgi:hypothetical protein